MYQINANNSSESNQYHVDNLIADLKSWWKSCPLFTRFLIFVCIIFFIPSFFGEEYQLVNIPNKTIGEFQITRLIFSPFVSTTVVELLFAFIAYLPMISADEKSQGTVRTTVDFFFKNLQISIAFIVDCYLLSLIIDKAFLSYSAHGLWCIFFAQLIVKCLENPNSNMPVLCLPIHIKTKFYPVAIFVILTIISHKFRLDLVVSGIIGFLNGKFINALVLGYLDDERIAAWESSQVIAWLKSLPNFVSQGSMSGPLIGDQDTANSNFAPIGNLASTTEVKNDPFDLFGGTQAKNGGENRNGTNQNQGHTNGFGELDL